MKRPDELMTATEVLMRRADAAKEREKMFEAAKVAAAMDLIQLTPVCLSCGAEGERASTEPPPPFNTTCRSCGARNIAIRASALTQDTAPPA